MLLFKLINNILEIIHPNAMEPIKKLSKKPISLSRATMDVLTKKGSDFIKKISMDENSEENNDEGNNKRTYTILI